MIRIPHVLAVAATLACSTAFAQAQQGTGSVERDVNQQKRIERGLKSGELNAQEAGKLEREQAVVNRMEAKAMQDGKLTDDEKRRLANAKNKASQDIYAQKHDAQKGNPNSAQSRALQADVQHNVDQQTRIARGMGKGTMSTREAAASEFGQGSAAGREGNAAKGGITAQEQAKIRAAEKQHSRNIKRRKHNG